MTEKVDALVIGAGPAGLMAAEILASQGRQVVVVDALPTPARKLLMAGKSGLNITKDEPLPDFIRHFRWNGLPVGVDQLGFGPTEVVTWAQDLGIDVFTGSTGRVFPVRMKASPLLRAWLARLDSAGVQLRNRWRWVGLRNGFNFITPDGEQVLTPQVAVLALGGASWPQLGSDASWVPVLAAAGVEMAPFRPANMGFCVLWSSQMTRFFGSAVKGVSIHAGNAISRGEWVISSGGIEGGGVYEISPIIRDGVDAFIDLAPDLTAEALLRRFERYKGKLSVGNWLRRVLGDPVKVALLLEWVGHQRPNSPAHWANVAKNLPLRHNGPMPLTRAISSAGGIKAEAVGLDLQLHALPGVFVAGEMLDWEAPTGGYLISGCLATGRYAGHKASNWSNDLNHPPL